MLGFNAVDVSSYVAPGAQPKICLTYNCTKLLYSHCVFLNERFSFHSEILRVLHFMYQNPFATYLAIHSEILRVQYLMYQNPFATYLAIHSEILRVQYLMYQNPFATYLAIHY